MKKQRLVVRTIILLLLAAAVGYTIYASLNKDKVQTIEKGKSAPDFSLVDLNGEKHKLSDYQGQGVLVNFWATWCGPCEREMPAINNQYMEFIGEDVTVLAVNIGESNLAIEKFLERFDPKLEFPILIDSDEEVQSAYNVVNLPATFLIDKEGILVDIHTGQLREDQVKEMLERIKP